MEWKKENLPLVFFDQFEYKQNTVPIKTICIFSMEDDTYVEYLVDIYGPRWKARKKKFSQWAQYGI